MGRSWSVICLVPGAEDRLRGIRGCSDSCVVAGRYRGIWRGTTIVAIMMDDRLANGQTLSRKKSVING
jgi:hypothetical protein